MDVILGLLGAIIGAIVQAAYSEREVRRKHMEDLAQYLRNLASCLEEMVQELEQNRVPTQAGNRIETTLKSFEAILSDTPLASDKREELRVVQSRLKLNLCDGRFLDEVIRGGILSSDSSEKTRILADMSRTAGYLHGAADTLKIQST
ncbi:MAG: hypothetical protein V7K26_15510 [Nostoc sp.]|uniref:hypothetical protein n=1 Tax=Nostoc sp. TaxID=1180 RepID=UPI002FEE6C73